MVSAPAGGDEPVRTAGETGEEFEFDRLAGILADGVVGAAGGMVGMALMTVVLLIAESLGAFSRASFATLTELMGLDGVVPAVTFGYLVFLAVGLVQWPLLFAALKSYLPGASDPAKGVVFGTTLWSGFVIAYYGGYQGTALALYVVLTLIAHWAYGFGLGLVFQYFTTRPDTLV